VNDENLHQCKKLLTTKEGGDIHLGGSA